MVLFWSGLVWISMSIPIYTKCSMCKYYHSIDSSNSVCRKFISIDNKPKLVNHTDKEYIENELCYSVENARYNNELCGLNATLYERRIH